MKTSSSRWNDQLPYKYARMYLIILLNTLENNSSNTRIQITDNFVIYFNFVLPVYQIIKPTTCTLLGAGYYFTDH
jgi:hypothetical protein